MSNKISLLALVENNSAFISHAQNQIVESALEVFPEAGIFEIFDNAKEMLHGLSKAFSHSKIVIVGADCSVYLSLKKLLLHALSLEGEKSKIIMSKISEDGKDFSESSALSHSLIPRDATVFVSEDGLFSGFALKSGKQHLIFLPLDCARIGGIIKSGLTLYLNSALSGSGSSAIGGIDQNIAINTTKKLLDEGLCVAIASTKTSVFIKNKLAAVPGSESTYKFVSCNEESTALTQKESAADLALRARENSGCAIGTAISSVFSSEKENGRLFILVTVADSLRARVAKVYAEAEETPLQLVEASVDTLLNMIGEYADAGGFVGFPIQEDDPEPPAEEIKSKNKLVLKLILSGAAAVLFCLLIIFFCSRIVIAIKNDSNHGNGSEETYTVLKVLTEVDDGAGNNIPSDEQMLLIAQMLTYTTGDNGTSAEADLTSAALTSKSSTVKNTSAVTTLAAPTTKKAVTTVTPTTATNAKTTSTVLTTSTTTAPKTTIAASTAPSQTTGTFVFSVKGYGHGVGMSQAGAKAYALQEKSYDFILLHYYNEGISLVDDSNPPSTVNYGGKDIDLNTYLARTVAKEISSSSPIETLKAQAVAAYTYAKYLDFKVSASQHAYDDDFDVSKDSGVLTAVRAVAGKYLSYKGAAASTPYFASSAGKTVSAESVWGSANYPYLAGGIESPETVSSSTATFTSEQIKDFVVKYNQKDISVQDISLSGSPSQWIQIISSDSAGYVEKIRVGDQTISGNTFRYHVLELGIKSHCFTFTYSD